MAKKSPTSHVTSADVKAALRLRYPSDAFGFFEEVGNATGARTERHADAVAVGLWPSRGLLIEGIEIKVSRSDWLSELKNPKKADAIAQFCDRWWLAVGDEAIVQPGELPASWGLLVLKAGKMVCKTEAPKLEPEGTPKGFLAAILRRAAEGLDRAKAEARAEGVLQGEQRGPAEHQQQITQLQNANAHEKRAIATFEERSGLKLNTWDAGHIGDAVKMLMKVQRYGHQSNPAEELELTAARIEQQAKYAADQLRGEAKAIKAAVKALGGTEAAE